MTFEFTIVAVIGFAYGIKICWDAWISWRQRRLQKQEERLWEETQHEGIILQQDPSSFSNFPTTYVPLQSQVGADYTKLRHFLAQKKWEIADQETQRIMCWVLEADHRGYLTTDDIEIFPCIDLRTIDQLWVQYSEGRFGFSVQKRIYESVGKNYNQFAEQVGWKKRGKWFESYSKSIFARHPPQGYRPFPVPILANTLDLDNLPLNHIDHQKNSLEHSEVDSEELQLIDDLNSLVDSALDWKRLELTDDDLNSLAEPELDWEHFQLTDDDLNSLAEAELDWDRLLLDDQHNYGLLIIANSDCVFCGDKDMELGFSTLLKKIENCNI